MATASRRPSGQACEQTVTVSYVQGLSNSPSTSTALWSSPPATLTKPSIESPRRQLDPRTVKPRQQMSPAGGDGMWDLHKSITVDHKEYGPPVPPDEARSGMNPKMGPGAFCASPWLPDATRLGDDVNLVFKAIIRASGSTGRYCRAFRRSLLEFYLIGRYGPRLPREGWEATLQLSPNQSGPLRAVLREADGRIVNNTGYMEGPFGPTEAPYGAECEVDGGCYSDDERSECESDLSEGDMNFVLSSDTESERGYDSDASVRSVTSSSHSNCDDVDYDPLGDLDSEEEMTSSVSTSDSESEVIEVIGTKRKRPTTRSMSALAGTTKRPKS
nr:US1 [Anatid alphaherpesvirus 1]WOZ29867.1 US1 [Anatid alphaherpesvirus 1]